jgi:hypothetical protein
LQERILSRQPSGFRKTCDDRVDYEQANGAVGLVIRLFNRIERWASASDDRATLVTILLCAGIAALVLVVFAVLVWFALLQGPTPE